MMHLTHVYQHAYHTSGLLSAGLTQQSHHIPHRDYITLHHHSAQSFQVSGAQPVLRLLQKTLNIKCHILPHHVFQQKLHLHVLNLSISSVHSCPEIQAKRVCPHTRQYLLWQFNEKVVGVMIMSYFTAFRMATTMYSKGCCFIHMMHDYTGTKKKQFWQLQPNSKTDLGI